MCVIYVLRLFMQQKSIAPMVHRQQTVDSLKKFNARRKLKVCRNSVANCVNLYTKQLMCLMLFLLEWFAIE